MPHTPGYRPATWTADEFIPPPPPAEPEAPPPPADEPTAAELYHLVYRTVRPNHPELYVAIHQAITAIWPRAFTIAPRASP